jgi:hypothetical protein
MPQRPLTIKKLNVHLYSVPPNEYHRRDVDSVLRAFGYKVKGADSNIDTRVAGQTRVDNWPVETSGNPYDPNTFFYNHVSSAEEFEETMETLVQHFEEFGEDYGSNQPVQQ